MNNDTPSSSPLPIGRLPPWDSWVAEGHRLANALRGVILLAPYIELISNLLEDLDSDIENWVTSAPNTGWGIRVPDSLYEEYNRWALQPSNLALVASCESTIRRVLRRVESTCVGR